MSFKEVDQILKSVCLCSHADDLAMIIDNIKHIQPQTNKLDLYFRLVTYGPRYKQKCNNQMPPQIQIIVC